MHFERRIILGGTAESVWSCLTEFDLRKRWMAQLVSEEVDDPENRGVGSTATVRMNQNNNIVTYRSTVIDWEPKRKLSVGISGGTLPPSIVMGVIYELFPGEIPGTTELNYYFHMPVKGFLFRIIQPLIRRGVAQVIDRDLMQLKALVESLGRQTTGV